MRLSLTWQGPFELIKNGMVLSKQIAKTGNAETSFIRGSYVDKGTWNTGKQIIRNCGVMGLYAGFRLQFSMSTCSMRMRPLTFFSSRDRWDCALLHDL
jgi:hypothetical protein